MVWRVPRIWEDGQVFILGGGPSLPRQFGVPERVLRSVLERKESVNAYSPYMAPIHSKHVIGVNAAFLIGKWIE